MTEPIFIVGCPRSGTTMLAAMIGSHSDIAVGPESQFFSKLSPQTLSRAVNDPEWPIRAVETLLGLMLAEQSVVDLFGLNKNILTTYLKDQTPSVSAMLEALTQNFAHARGKSRWAEKTPNHILAVDQLRTLWPRARVIRILRDPRDAALSTCRLPTFSNSFLANLYLWRRWQDRAEMFFKHDPLSITVKYEDIVKEPEKILRSLCTFLNVAFEEDMLNFGATASDVSSEAETWKRSVASGLTEDRMFVWKRELPETLRQVANDAVYEYLRHYNYDHKACSRITHKVFRLSPEFVERHEAYLINLHQDDERWLPSDDVSEADYLFEDPRYSRLRNPIYLFQKYRDLSWLKKRVDGTELSRV